MSIIEDHSQRKYSRVYYSGDFYKNCQWQVKKFLTASDVHNLLLKKKGYNTYQDKEHTDK